MTGLSIDQREQIRDAIDIVDLVGRDIPLQRQGRMYVGRCPWHDDKRPSLQVNPERQTFKCWVCNIGGDVFSYIMQRDGCDFRKALETLADSAGITLQKSPFRKKGSFSGNGNQNLSDPNPEVDTKMIYAALDWLSQKYHDIFLTDPEAEPARKYVRERGINDQMIEQFRIGYAPLRSNYLVDLLGGDRNRIHVLELGGVLSRRDEYSSFYDRFRGRVIFPIRDNNTRTVAFGGRILPDSPLKSDAKYVNSPETEVFSKYKMLYGLDLARTYIQRTKQVLITEGYTDCIMAHQYGFPNAVAVLGTALGPEHVKILDRLADRMILLLDGDEAGKKRAREVLHFFIERGVDMSVLTLPEGKGKDPCEFLIENGADAFEELLKTGPVDAMDHAFRAAIQGIDLDKDIVASTRALNDLLGIIALFPAGTGKTNDPVRLRMERTIQRFSQRFRIREEEVRKRIRELRQQNTKRTYSWDREEKNEPREPVVLSDRDRNTYPIGGSENDNDSQLKIDFEGFSKEIWKDEALLPTQLEKDFLEFWFVFPNCFAEMSARIPIDLLRSPVSRQIFRLGLAIVQSGRTPTFERILIRYEDADMKNFLIGIDESASEKDLADRFSGNDLRERLKEDILAGFDRRRIELEQPKKINQLRDGELSGDEEMKKLLELQQLLIEKQKTRTGGTVFMEEDRPEPR
ncbi:MAG: DNA primase [Planctomycetia bacterium]|nr:DNA primase [Planctomycetia bacterium]